MLTQNKVHLDFETRSELDLIASGAWKYSKHPSTEIICMSYKIGDGPVKSWRPENERSSVPMELYLKSADENVLFIAHNAGFERAIWQNVLNRTFIHGCEIKLNRWRCTAAKAAAMSLPRSLEDAALALKLKNQKDMEGNRLIKQVSKPRPTWFPTSDKPKWFEEEDKIQKIIKYCNQDVEVEAELDHKLPDLTPQEQELWFLDQILNERGFQIDVEAVESCLKVLDIEIDLGIEELTRITQGEVISINQNAAMLRWLKKNNVWLENLQAKTITDYLAEHNRPCKAHRVLQLRQDLGKSSTSKLYAFMDRVEENGRVRENLLYGGATPTMRWAGKGVQPQNFPRGTIKDTHNALEAIKLGGRDLLLDYYDEAPLKVLSSCLRGIIIPTNGSELFVADFNAIEARAVMWLAGAEAALKAFASGADLYCDMATDIYGFKVLKALHTLERFVGKEAILGCGFGMGANKFLLQCKNKGIIFDEDEKKALAFAEKIIKKYRSKFYQVPELWRRLENCAIYTTRTGKPSKANNVVWTRNKDYLFAQIPSGRKLAYYGPHLKEIKTPWGEPKSTLHYWGVDSKTKQWQIEKTYGGKITENLVQGIARDLMAQAMLRVEKAGYNIVLTVHDEIVSERKLGEGNVKEYEKLIAQVPAWASGCPIGVEAWNGLRYKK